MATLSPVDAVLSAGQRIGRYFTLVSLIPALLFVLWIYLLISTGTLSGTPSLATAETALSHWTVGRVVGVLLASLTVAVVLHPLQFATTQLLEGYWGTSALARTAMNLRILHHRRRQRHLSARAAESGTAWETLRDREIEKHPELQKDVKKLEARKKYFTGVEVGDPSVRFVVAQQEALRLSYRDYPRDAARILPTRLGNALRCFEDSAGRQYGLCALTISTHLHLVAPPRHLDYLVDARQAMDSAIRVCTVGLVATVVTAGLMLTRGWWLLWTIVPYAVSYLAYHGAVSAARGYGIIVTSVIDIDRFLLYQEFGLDRPRDSAEERENNAALMKLLDGGTPAVRYRREASASERPRAARPRPKSGPLPCWRPRPASAAGM
jgi:hypothetical protein